MLLFVIATFKVLSERSSVHVKLHDVPFSLAALLIHQQYKCQILEYKDSNNTSDLDLSRVSFVSVRHWEIACSQLWGISLKVR